MIPGLVIARIEELPALRTAQHHGSIHRRGFKSKILVVLSSC